jgi:hypothetical protein
MVSVSLVAGVNGVVGVNTMVPPWPACQLPGTAGLNAGSGEPCESAAEKTTCTGSWPFTPPAPLPGVTDTICSGFGAEVGRGVAEWLVATGVLSAAADRAGLALPKVNASTTPPTSTTPIAVATMATRIFEPNNRPLPRRPRAHPGWFAARLPGPLYPRM